MNDRGSVIVGYFAKIALVLTLFAVLAFDAVSVVVARVGIEDTARGAARAASEAWDDGKDVNVAYRAAVRFAEDEGAEVDRESFRVDEKGRVTLTARKEATTLLLYRSSKTGGWARVDATATARAI